MVRYEILITLVIYYRYVHVYCDIVFATYSILFFSEALSAGTGLGSGGGSVLLQGVNCSGSEQYILDCPRSFPVGITQCTHVQDVGVACQPQIFPGIQCYILL